MRMRNIHINSFTQIYEWETSLIVFFSKMYEWQTCANEKQSCDFFHQNVQMRNIAHSFLSLKYSIEKKIVWIFYQNVRVRYIAHCLFTKMSKRIKCMSTFYQNVWMRNIARCFVNKMYKKVRFMLIFRPKSCEWETSLIGFYWNVRMRNI